MPGCAAGSIAASGGVPPLRYRLESVDSTLDLKSPGQDGGGLPAADALVKADFGIEMDEEARRFLAFMKFPNVQDIGGYSELLSSNGCEVVMAEDTERFAPYVDLYLQMLNMQLTYDALKIIGFDSKMLEAISQEMVFLQQLAHANKIAQGLFVARKK